MLSAKAAFLKQMLNRFGVNDPQVLGMALKIVEHKIEGAGWEQTTNGIIARGLVDGEALTLTLSGPGVSLLLK